MQYILPIFEPWFVIYIKIITNEIFSENFTLIEWRLYKRYTLMNLSILLIVSYVSFT